MLEDYSAWIKARESAPARGVGDGNHTVASLVGDSSSQVQVILNLVIRQIKMNVKGRKYLQKFMLIPQRYLLAIMAFLAITNAYQMRVCLNVAITEMVRSEPSNNKTTSGDGDSNVCPVIDDGSGTSQKPLPDDAVVFDWSEEMQGLILSSFYWGYVLTHIPGGIIADKFGGKYALGVGLLSTSVFTLLMPVAANSGDGWLLAVRLMTGFGEGTTFPAVSNLLAKWVPADERAFWGSFVFAGGQIGTITGTLITGALLDTYRGDWPRVFYVFGGIGIIWCLAFFLLCFSSPDSHPFISDKEKKYLNDKIPQDKNLPSPPMRHILTSLPLFGLVCAQIGHDWGFYTMVTDLPKYMKDVLKFSIGANAVLSSLPYIVMWIMSLASGWVCDQLIRRKVVTVTLARRIFTTVAHLGPSAGLIGASYAGCDRTTVVVLFCVVMGTMGFFYPGMKVNAMDLSPNYAGTLMAIVNGIGGITGIITPYLVGVMTPNHTLLEWRTVFWITVGVNLITIVIFDVFSSGEIQPWNDVRNLQTKVTPEIEDHRRTSIGLSIVQIDERKNESEKVKS